MNLKRLKPTFVVLVASHYVPLIAQPQVEAPSAALFTTLETAHAPLKTGEPVAVWNWGAVVSVENARSEAPTIQTMSRTGSFTRSTLSIPGVRLVNIYSGRFARGPDGSLAVTGSAYTDDSRAASFLLLISRDGKQQKFVQLSPFVAGAVTIASDGTIWAAGREIVAGKELNPNHHVVRRFDPAGRMMASLIPRSSLVTKPGYEHPVEYSYLVSSKDRVGWYSEATGTYREFALDGTQINQFDTPSTTGMPGIALCDDGNLFVSSGYRRPTGEKGWGIYVLVRDRGIWTFGPRSEKWGTLLGCDGTKVVSMTDVATVAWLEPK